MSRLQLHRYPPLDAREWKLENTQPFFPSLEGLFKTEQVSSFLQYGVKLKEEIRQIVNDKEVVLTSGRRTPIHRKTTMILSPFKWMRGDYGGAVGLPKPESMAKDMQKVLQSHHTAGYVGALASILLSETGCPHFPRVYGVYTGMATEHTIDISDDYEDLTDKSWFLENLGKTFTMRFRGGEPEVFTHTRTARRGLLMSEEDVDLGDIPEEDADHVSNPASRREGDVVSYGSSAATSIADEETEEDDEDVFAIESCRCEGEDDGVEEESEDEDEPFAWATFSNVPVITTAMEVCEGTLYDLLEQYPNDVSKHIAWMAQIVIALKYANRRFQLNHNDLHGNNVMWVRTNEEYLYYKLEGAFPKTKDSYYRVPTYGYLLKIIDFDRATYSVRLPGMKKARFFMSSHFDVDEEAAGQYNCEPFYDPTHPPIYPNGSFDLTRLATSLYWDMFPEGSASQHPLEKVFQQWMTQDDGTSVMFRAGKEPNHDRYHGFDLYKAIARYCHRGELCHQWHHLTTFRVESVPSGVSVFLL